MKQPDKNARQALREITADEATTVAIAGTRRTVKVRGIKPYTIECLTKLWGEREMQIPEDSSDTLKAVCIDPYFSVKCACTIVLNSYWKLRLLYPIKWRIWAFLRGYTEAQMEPIIIEGKKKLPLEPFWRNMVYLTDMRADWMRMTTKEAETFQAEQILAAKVLSSKNTPATAGPGSASDAGNGIGDIGAF